MPVSGTPKEIIHEEMHRFKHGQLHSGPDKYGHLVHDPKQAIAIALSVARRKGKADGGGLGSIDNSIMRQSIKGALHTGAIRGGVPGRTDHVPLVVPNGSYVLPASHVSHLGQNNTEAGFTRLDHALGPSPFGGGKTPSIHHGRGPPSAHAPSLASHNNAPPGMHTAKTTAAGIFHQGGVTGGDDKGVKIMAASGEYVVSPEHVEKLGRAALEDQYGEKAKSIGSEHALDIGHEILDAWVEQTKKKHIDALRKLPGPSK